ncbi:MAG: iron-sulfur cluster assembly scaffold protein [Steroidobacteraceae bacterium]
MSVAPFAAGIGDSLSPLAREFFDRLAHAGRFPQGGPVVSGEAGLEATGTRVRFHLLLAGPVVAEARFQAYGCPHTLAVASWLAGELAGRRREALVPGTPADWAGRFEVPVAKLGRLLVVEDALRDCIANWPPQAPPAGQAS